MPWTCHSHPRSDDGHYPGKQNHPDAGTCSWPPSTLFWDEDNYHFTALFPCLLNWLKIKLKKKKVKDRVSGNPGMTSDIVGLTVEQII